MFFKKLTEEDYSILCSHYENNLFDHYTKDSGDNHYRNMIAFEFKLQKEELRTTVIHLDSSSRILAKDKYNNFYLEQEDHWGDYYQRVLEFIKDNKLQDKTTEEIMILGKLLDHKFGL